MAIVQIHVPLERLLQTGPAVEVVHRQNRANEAVEARHHAVSLWRFRPGQPVLDAQGLAERVEFVATGDAFGSRSEQPAGELIAGVGEQGPDKETFPGGVWLLWPKELGLVPSHSLASIPVEARGRVKTVTS